MLKFKENPVEVVANGATAAVVVAGVEVGNENPVPEVVVDNPGAPNAVIGS